MLQQTIQRLPTEELAEPLIVTNEEHRFLVAEQMREIGYEARIILEPEGRNTAPSLALAALDLVQRGMPQATMVVLAADHEIKDTAHFQQRLWQAIDIAQTGDLVTFGVVPEYAATGYGYIRGERRPASGVDTECYRISEFWEKPDLETAQAYLASGEYYWNSGMFVLRADSYVNALQTHCPLVYETCSAAIRNTQQDLDFVRIDNEAFLNSPNISVDHAVMEYTSKGAMIPLEAGWSDLGSWASLWQLNDKDEQQNVVEGDVLLEQTSGSFIHAGHKLVATLGVKDLVIVDTADALLVADKESAQDVKGLVTQLEAQQREERLHHREVMRPWGKYDSIAVGNRYHVKRITVNPGASLSLQRHQFRAEHWVIVKGIAEVRCGDRTLRLGEDQSTYIPVGEVHKLTNPGDVPLELIEVQTGSYVGEDDIIRLEDCYGRD